jgi:hypothetical protein
MITVEYAKNPRWANPEHTTIDLIVKFLHLQFEVPFSASRDDGEAHGKGLYEQALAGDYGDIIEYSSGDAVTQSGPIE